MTSYYYKCQIFPNLSSSTVQKHRKNNECCVPLIPNPDKRLFRFQVCYCDISVLRTPRTLLRVLVLVRSTSCLFPESIYGLSSPQLTSVACLSSVLTSGSARLGLSALPHFPKLRLIIFVSLAAALFSLLVVFLNISHLHALLPMDYAKMVGHSLFGVLNSVLPTTANRDLPAAGSELLSGLILGAVRGACLPRGNP